jgi:hypothetical protein
MMKPEATGWRWTGGWQSCVLPTSPTGVGFVLGQLLSVADLHPTRPLHEILYHEQLLAVVALQ